MATITTRSGKGSALTHQEVDANFTGLNTELGQKELASNKGVANGYASLDAAGKVPSAQLPSYVDDVVETANLASLPGTGETGKIYVTLDTNKTYRWSGSAYVEISPSPGSTDSLAEGSTNLYFTQARARASVSASGSLSYNSSTGVFSFSDAVTSVAGRTGAVTLTSSDVGLGNVENKSSATIRGELTSGNVTTALGFTPYNSSNPSGYLTDAMRNRGSVAQASVDSATLDGFYTQNNPGDSDGVLVFNSGGSLGPLQMRFKYTGLFEFRNKTDSANWNSWKQVLHSGNYSSGYFKTINGSSIIGTGDLTVSDSTKLPLSGGTISGNLTVNGSAYYSFGKPSPSGYQTTALFGTTGGGLFITSDNAIISKGAYYNNGWIATATSGSAIDFSTATPQIFYFSGATVGAAPSLSANYNILHAGNYNDYAPSKTGTGAQGTWSISITGNAATATSADQIDGWGFVNTGSNASVNADTIDSNGISYYTAGVPNFTGNSTDGALYSQRYNSSWQHQIAADYRSGQIALRGKNNGTWQSWRTVLDSSNYSGYALPLTGGTITGTALQVGTAFTYDNPGGWNANIVAAGSAHARFRLRATSFAGSGDRETYLWLDNTVSPATGIYSNASTFNFVGSIGTVQVNGNTILHAGNFSSYAVPARTRSSWNDSTVINNVVGQLAWKNYGGNHTIFDASASTAPDGTAVDRTNAAVAWSGSYPTLMGWNGSSTYGVRVDSARVSDTVGGLTPAKFFNNMGNNHGTYTDFNSVPDFGAYYVQQGGNSPTGVASHQWYGFTLGLGNEYAQSSYASQLYWPRRAQNGETYIYVRDREGGTWNGWTKIRAGAADSVGGRSPGGSAGNLAYYDSSNAYLYAPTWIGIGSGSGIFSTNGTNGAHWHPTGAAFGVWNISGSKGGYSGISCNGTNHYLNWMVEMNGNLQGWYNQSYGWQMFWSGGSLYCFKNAYGGGTQATVLDSSNYASYAGGLSTGNTWTAYNYFVANRNTTSDSPPLQAYSNNGSGAIMSFHRAGQYAVNFGLDSDNVMRIGGWSAGANRWQLDMSGNGTYAGNVTAYSDERLKTDWSVIESGFVERLAVMRCGTYTRIDSGQRQAGVSAQNMREILPEVVSEDNDGTLALAYGNAALVSAVELAKELVALKHKVAELEARVH